MRPSRPWSWLALACLAASSAPAAQSPVRRPSTPTAPKPVSSSAPGTLATSQTEPLGPLIAGTEIATQRPALPASAAQIAVLTCTYHPAEVRRFWHATAPPWLAAIPAGHPLNKLVRGTEKACPSTLSAATAAATTRIAAPAPEPLPATQAVPPAQHRPSVPLPSMEPDAASFKGEGLQYGRAMAAIFRGDFEQVGLARDSHELSVMLSSYLETFGRNCPDSLPPNKVEITKQVCTRERYSVNRYGSQVGSSWCVDWATVGTGVYADPELYAASKQLERAKAADALRDAFAMIAKGDFGLGLVHVIQTMRADVAELVRGNGCRSIGLRRFQDNLRLYAIGGQPIRLAGGSGSAAPPSSPSAPSAPSAPAASPSISLNRLIEDLVTAASRSWSFNRYQQGTVSGASITSTDTDGRPMRARAVYSFVSALEGRPKQGSVNVEFRQGVPSCLYFFDFPSVCRPPDAGVLARLQQGAYAATRE